MTYRRKNNYDVMVATEHLRSSALDDYPVEKICGPSLSLRYLYGVQGTKGSESGMSSLLNHLLHQIRKTSVYSSKKDSQATLSLTLCGWHRSKVVVVYDGKRVTELDRAILQEEAEYRELLRGLRKED